MFEYCYIESKALASAFIALLTFLWLGWRRKKLKIFEELGIPGPPPHFLFGNLLEINKKGFLQCQEEWVKKYGKAVGYFHGLTPILMITDKDILKNIFIKDFHLFSDRPEIIPLRVHSFLDYIIPASQLMDTLLPNQKGENWKRMRSKLSPIFSTNKLKMVVPYVDKVTDVTISILEKKARQCETIDLYDLLQRLTLDIICAQSFAIQTDIQNEGMNNSLFRSAKTIFDNPSTSKILIFGLCFPEFGILGMAMNFLKMFFANGFSIPPLRITNVVGKVIEQRRKYPDTRKPDLLQSLIDASEIQNEDEPRMKRNDTGTATANEKKTNTTHLKQTKKQGLTDMEIKASALVVFLAGYETTSSSLAYVFYMLTKYPEYQAEIQKEIEKCVDSKELDYCMLSNLQLMERFFMETLRIYPPVVNFVGRVATADVEYDYLHIPRGMQITVPVSYMHSSEDNWKNAEVFDPDRFLAENRTNRVTNYWAFGIGPRNCNGMRLANITSKVVLAKLLRKFSFEVPDDPEEAKMCLKVKAGTMVPDKVIVKVKERVHPERKEETFT